MTNSHLFNDDPVDGSLRFPDLLGRKEYARHAVSMLRRVREQSDSGVLALIGAWGSGKSSVLQMIIGLLQQDGAEPWLVAELNPWMYSDLDSMTTALFAEIRSALPEKARWSETRKRLGDFGEALSPLGALGGLVGVNSEKAFQMISARVRGDTSVSAVKRTAEAALRELDQPILVVMDDLDRLTPDEVLLIFKLVRLVGYLPNVHYLLSYDERTLLDVLSRSDLVGGKGSRASEFLEKIVQVRLDLPAFRDRDAVAMVNQCLATVLRNYECQMDSTDESRFQEAYFDHLQERLTTPRSIKRFFGQVDAGMRSVVSDVDIVDYMVMTFLRTMEPGVFSMIKRYQAELTKTKSSRPVPPGAQSNLWRDRVAAAGTAEEYVDGVLQLLGLLFSTVSDTFNHWTSSASFDADRRRGVGSNDYFDRYTTFSVPEDDLAEEAFERALEQVALGAPGPEHDEFVTRLREDTHRVTRRIRQRKANVPARCLLGLLGDEIGQVSAPAEQMGLFTPQASIGFLAGKLLSLVPMDERPATLQRMAQTPAGAVLAAESLRRVLRPTDDQPQESLGRDHTFAWASTSRDLLSDSFRAHLATAIGRPVDQLSIQEILLVRTWGLFASDQTKSWIRHALAQGAWQLLSLLVRLSLSHPFEPDRISVDLDQFDAMIGLDYIDTELAVQIASAPLSPSQTATNEELVLIALHQHSSRANVDPMGSNDPTAEPTDPS